MELDRVTEVVECRTADETNGYLHCGWKLITVCKIPCEYDTWDRFGTIPRYVLGWIGESPQYPSVEKKDPFEGFTLAEDDDFYK